MKTKHPMVIATGFLLILYTLLLWVIVWFDISSGGDPGWAITLSIGAFLSVLSLVAAVGVFIVTHWGMWLAVVASVLVTAFAIGGIVLSGTSPSALPCIVLGVLSILVIVLAILPSTRQSYGTRLALTGERAN